MRGSAWRLAAAVLGSMGICSLVADGQQGPVVRVASASDNQPKPQVSVNAPADPGTANQSTANLRQQLKETQDRLLAFEAENEALRRRNDSNKETIHALTESLAVANAECEVFRRKFGEQTLRMEALGLAAVGDNKEALEQRLLQAVRDLALVRDEKDVLAERLVALSESVMLYLKTASGSDPKLRMEIEGQLREANKSVDEVAAKDAAPSADAQADLSNGRVLSFKEEYSLIVVNLGSRQGVKIGTPFLVTRDGKLVAKARVVDVRDRYSGAVIEEYGSTTEKVKVGDQMHVDFQS